MVSNRLRKKDLLLKDPLSKEINLLSFNKELFDPNISFNESSKGMNFAEKNRYGIFLFHPIAFKRLDRL